MTGYSDRINHAFAFAAKHHDQQVRKGTSAPYLTRPANVAVILTRYDQDDDTVLGGILHDVVEDFVRDGYSRETLDSRIGEKFGGDVLETVLAVVKRRESEEGVELSGEEQREDYLERFGQASPRSLWACAAGELHITGSILADLRRTSFPDAVWGRFGAGREATIRWHRRVYDRLRVVGFDAPIMEELRATVNELETHSRPESTRTDPVPFDSPAGPGARGR